ncbi:MAG: phenylalanine--tRNA ligase beta subunit-related protein [Patescibacteria group bacterium]
MKISMKLEIFELWPEARLGLVYVSQVNNRADLSAWKSEQQRIETVVHQLFPNTEAVGKHPNIQAWRKAYRQFGCDPHDYRCSAEALARQVVKGNNIWGINPLVDVYNFISLKYTLPVGGEDAAKVQGEVQLKRAVGTEPFVRLGGTENESPEPGEVVYADDLGVLCRRWNWREADRTKLTPETTSAILVIEIIPPTTGETVQQATAELAQLVVQWCGAKTQTKVLSQQDSSVDFA